MKRFLQKCVFIIQFRYKSNIYGLMRKCWYTMLGMQIGKGTTLSSMHITWPHQVSIGIDCLLEHNIYFKFDGIWQPGTAIQINNRVFIGVGCEFNISQKIEIGDDALIASGCRFIDHNHGTCLGELMRNQQGTALPIKIGANTWLGCNVVVLKGVTIGDGAVVAAGAVVTKSIPTNEIWAGIPARKIGQRTS